MHSEDAQGDQGDVPGRPGRECTPEEIQAFYALPGYDGIRTNLKLIRPHLHECPHCDYKWYCEKEDGHEPYIPAVAEEGAPTSPEHECPGKNA